MDNENQASAEPNSGLGARAVFGEGSPELAATGACVAALEDLDADVQDRVVAYLAGRFGNLVRPVAHGGRLITRRVIG